jgi:hypothetical protein
MLRKRVDGGHRGAAAPGTESAARNNVTANWETEMKRSTPIIAASTLLVRPQQWKKLSDTGQKRKHLLQMPKHSPKKQSVTTDPFKITIEMVSFSEYYPHRNPEKLR